MLSNLADHRKGFCSPRFGGLALSFDIPLIRFAEGDVWSLLAVRSLCTFVVALVAWSCIRSVLASLRNALCRAGSGFLPASSTA